MMNFKKSKASKVVSGFVGLATAVMMMGPAAASAVTVEELQAQINVLLAQLATLQAGSGAVASGYTFTMNLTIGSTGNDVVELQKVLVAKGHLTMPAGVAMGYFGPLTRAAVAKWQAAEGISPAVGYFGPISRANMNAGAGTGTGTGSGTGTGTGAGTVTGTGVSAMLDASSKSTTFIAGQAVGTLAVFKVSNFGSAAAKVTSVKLKRSGISADTTLSNVYLYDGATRLTDSAAVASGVISFNDTAGVVMIPAGSSILLSVRADIAASTNGQTVGVMLTDMTVDGAALAGLPLSGPESSIAALPSGAATVNYGATTLPSSAATVDPTNDFTMWQNTVTIGSRDVVMDSIRLRQIGSILAGDLKNFRLYVDGVQVGSAVDSVNSSGYVTFTFAAPVTLKSGSRVMKLVGDIVGGSTRTFSFSLRQPGDAEMRDSQLGFTVLPTANSVTFSARSSETQTVASGSLTITKASGSTSGNVVDAASSVTFAKFDVKASGEKLKIENLRVSFTPSDAGGVVADDAAKLRNGAIFWNGVQVGSTADICADDATSGGAVCSTNYTTYSFGSSVIVEPGTTGVLEVRGDVFDNDGTNNMGSGDTFTINIAAGSTNVQRMTSLSYLANSAVSGNTLTVATGALTLSKYTAYSNQTITVPKTAHKIGEFRLSASASEGVNIHTFTLGVGTGTQASNDALVSHYTDVYIVYGAKQTTAKATVASSSNTFSVNHDLAANETIAVAVYGTLSTSIASDKVVSVNLDVDGTSKTSGSAVAVDTAAGQLLTVSTGSLTPGVDASTPVASNVVGGSMPKVASFKYTSLYDSFTIKDLGVSVGGPDNASAIIELVFKDGTTELRRASFNGNIATGTDLNVAVTANSTKVIDVYANLGSIGVGYATTSQNVDLTVSSVKFQNSSGTISYDNTASSGNNTYVFKSKPTIMNAALPSTVLTSGTIAIGKVTISADSAGSVSWRKLVWNVSTSSPSTGQYVVSAPALYDAADESTTLSGVTVTLNQTASAASTFNITASSSAAAADQSIGAGQSKTYVLKATVTGTIVAGASINTTIAASSTSRTAPSGAQAASIRYPSFLWSDNSALSHTELTSDWMDDYLIKNIPTDSQTVKL